MVTGSVSVLPSVRHIFAWKTASVPGNRNVWLTQWNGGDYVMKFRAKHFNTHFNPAMVSPPDRDFSELSRSERVRQSLLFTNEDYVLLWGKSVTFYRPKPTSVSSPDSQISISSFYNSSIGQAITWCNVDHWERMKTHMSSSINVTCLFFTPYCKRMSDEIEF